MAGQGLLRQTGTVGNQDFILDRDSTELNRDYFFTKRMEVAEREEEIDFALQRLMEPGNKSFLFVGPAGAGKSVLLEEVAHRIVTGKVPRASQAYFSRFRFFKIGLESLCNLQGYVGNLEMRVNAIKAEITRLQNECDPTAVIVLVIDETHGMIGMGRTRNNPNDLLNMFKDKIAEGNVVVIGATTAAEYKEHFEGDASQGANLRRFPAIMLREPDFKKIMRMVREHLRTLDDGILFLDAAKKAAVILSRHLLGEQPHKTIDLLQRARADRNQDLSSSREVRLLQERIKDLRSQIEIAREEGATPELEEKLEQQLQELRATYLQKEAEFQEYQTRYRRMRACKIAYDHARLAYEEVNPDDVQNSAKFWVEYVRARRVWQLVLQDTENLKLGVVRVQDIVRIVAERAGLSQESLEFELMTVGRAAEQEGEDTSDDSSVEGVSMLWLASLEKALDGVLWRYDSREATRQRREFFLAQFRRTMVLGATMMAFSHLIQWWTGPAAMQAPQTQPQQDFTLWSVVSGIVSPLLKAFGTGALIQVSLVAAEVMKNPQQVISDCYSIQRAVAEYKSTRDSDQFFRDVIPSIRQLVVCGVLAPDLFAREWLGGEVRVPQRMIAEAPVLPPAPAKSPLLDSDFSQIYRRVRVYLDGSEAPEAQGLDSDAPVEMVELSEQYTQFDKYRSSVTSKDVRVRLFEILRILQQLDRIKGKTPEVLALIFQFQWLLAFHLTQAEALPLALDLADQCMRLERTRVLESALGQEEQEKLKIIGRLLRLHIWVKNLVELGSVSTGSSLVLCCAKMCRPASLESLREDRFRVDLLPWLSQLESKLDTAFSKSQEDLLEEKIEMLRILENICIRKARIFICEIQRILGDDKEVCRAQALLEQAQQCVVKFKKMEEELIKFQKLHQITLDASRAEIEARSARRLARKAPEVCQRMDLQERDLQREVQEVERELRGQAIAAPASLSASSDVGFDESFVAVVKIENLLTSQRVREFYEKYREKWCCIVDTLPSAKACRSLLSEINEIWPEMQEKASEIGSEERWAWQFLLAECAGLKAKLCQTLEQQSSVAEVVEIGVAAWAVLLSNVRGRSGKVKVFDVDLTEKFIQEKEERLRKYGVLKEAAASAEPPKTPRSPARASMPFQGAASGRSGRGGPGESVETEVGGGDGDEAMMKTLLAMQKRLFEDFSAQMDRGREQPPVPPVPPGCAPS